MTASTVIAYGGGVQSTALVVLAATGRITADGALFANVGETAEHPATLRYVRDVAVPWAAERGLTIHEVQRRPTSTKDVDLRVTMMGHHDRSLNEPIPVYGSSGGPMGRQCTGDWKIGAMQRWLKDRDMLPAVSLIGISTDEIQRAGRGTDPNGYSRSYPLLSLGFSRTDCAQVIRDAGLPVPPKSACYFCPFHRPQVWAELRRDEPDLFDKAQELEDRLNARRAAVNELRGNDHFEPVYLTRFGRRLEDAIGEAQPALFDVADLDNPTDIGESGCDEGVCFV